MAGLGLFGLATLAVLLGVNLLVRVFVGIVFFGAVSAIRSGSVGTRCAGCWRRGGR